MTKNGINKGTHQTIMTQIIIDIYKDKYLSNKLGFKGGTACFLFYDLPRFSVDLDFNLLDNENIEPQISEILEKYGELKDFSNKKNTIFWLLNYEKGLWNLKIEISKRNYDDKFEIKDFYGTSVLVMKKEYIFAHKLVALTDRSNPVGRDLFDINFFISNHWKFNSEIIEKRTQMDTKDYLQYLIEYVEKNYTNKLLLDGLGELIDKSQRNQTKDLLLENIKQKLKIFLDNIDSYAL
jgi:predicted nucleotidyltransferase component of viral defense system